LKILPQWYSGSIKTPLLSINDSFLFNRSTRKALYWPQAKLIHSLLLNT
jgi:hypothetical protein